MSDSERRELAAMPLPKLPNLRPRDTASAAAPVEQILPPIQAKSPTPKKPETSAGLTAGDTAPPLLQKATDRTGLGEPELARISAAKNLLDSGDTATATQQLQALNDEFDAATSEYPVKAGETLRQIANLPDTYGNLALWPLIYRANKAQLLQQARLHAGQRLVIPRFPSLADVSDALAYTRSHIGEGRTPAAASP